MFQETKSIDNKPSRNLTAQNSKDKHLISDVHFQQLTTLRDEVYNATEVNPTIRKLLYLIIEKADLEAIRNQLISQYS